MKKFFSILAASTLSLLAFTACEDVPAPYGINGGTTDSTNVDTDVILEESFSQSLGSFTTVGNPSSIVWSVSYSSAQVTGYIDTDGDDVKENNAATSWLISPAMDLSSVSAANVSFSYILRYALASTVKENHALLISSDYNGDPNTATWTQLDFNLVQGSDWDTWYESGSINVPTEFCGKQGVRVALRYISTAEKASTWEVKNFKVQKGAGTYNPGTSGDDGSVKTLPYSETFASELGAFTNYTTSGSGEWTIDYSTAKAAGYNSSTKVTTPGTYYLVSPQIQLTSNACHVSYDYILRYLQADDNQQLLISTTFDATDPTSGWTVLKGDHTEGSDWSTFAAADVQIPSEYLGKTVRFALRYNCAESGSTWEVKNFSVKEGNVGDGGGDDTSLANLTVGDATSANYDFENWTKGKPYHWTTTSTACNATLSATNDAHGGKYAVIVEGSTAANKRLAYEEMTLEGGKYLTISFWVKAVTGTASVRPGYVPVTDGKVGSYVYGSYVNNITTEWQYVTQTISTQIASTMTGCPVIMVSKNPGGSVIIDDVTFTYSDSAE